MAKEDILNLDLGKLGKMVALLVGLGAILSTTGMASVKLLGVETTRKAEQRMEVLRQEREAVLQPMQVELRYIRGLVECDSRGITWEQCPVVQQNLGGLNGTSTVLP